MAFHSFPFLLGFLPLTLAGYALASRGGVVWAKAWLVAVSLMFYGLMAGSYVPVLLASVGGNLLVLRYLPRTRHRSAIVATAIVANLAVLGWFKFAAPLIWPDAGLPLGISFFTFTQIGALLAFDPDEPPAPPLDRALFVLFFPALIAGPILNPRDMMPQLRRTEGWHLTGENLAVGAGFFLLGLLKKTLLADPLGRMVAVGFSDPDSLSLAGAWQTATAWSLELYFDFSGYTDMAIGLAWMFGIVFPDNFEQPYRARSVIAYWQAWHMSLTRFLMSYVHAPLTLAILRWRRQAGLPIDGMAQRSAMGFLTMIATPILSTMLLAGIWHGSAATYAVFGAMHGVFLLINHAWRLFRGPALPAAVSVILTYGAVLVGSVVFRAASLGDAAKMLAGMAGWHGSGTIEARDLVTIVWLAALYGVIWLAPTTRQFMTGRTARAWRPTPRWAVVMGSLATLALLGAGGTSEFVYFSF